MKVTIDIDCTPEEARAFLGLPDVKPMQEWMMKEMQGRISASIGSMGMEEMMKIWLPAGMTGLDQMRDFYSRMAAAAARRE